MPRNSQAVAIEAAKTAEANYRAAAKALLSAAKARRQAVVRCRRAGISYVAIGKLFGVTDAQCSAIYKQETAKPSAH